MPWLYSFAAYYLREERPEMYSEILAATLEFDPTTTPMDSLVGIVEWAVDLDRMDDCELLRQRFPEFPEYVIDQPEDESTGADSDPDPEPEFPPEIHAALDKIWADFDTLDPPTPEQVEAFLTELLALPHGATSWNDVFNQIVESGHADLFKTLHRFAALLSPTRNKDFAYVCWPAVEEVNRLKAPERLPEIARALLDFNPETCDPDALSHIADALLAHGFVNEMIELLTAFLPSLRNNENVMDRVLPRVAEEIFLLRLGTWIASDDYSGRPIDQVLADLCVGLHDDILKESASVPLRYLIHDREIFSREQFTIPSSTKDSGKQKLLWNRLQQAFVEVARDAWLTENCNPSRTLIGLSMILRSVEYWVNSPREKGQKYPLNLLDYLNAAAMDRVAAIECGGFLGINRDRARIMLDACITLLRWTGRQGLLGEADTAATVDLIEKLTIKISH